MPKDPTSTPPPRRPAAPTSPVNATNGYAATRPLGATARGAKLPRFGDRTRPFMLGAHYSSWELIKTSVGWRLVPTLKPLVFKPGVNWTPTPAKGKPLDTTVLEAKARTRFEFTVLSNMADYLVEVEGEDKPGIFLKWENVKVYRDGKWSVTTDEEGYALWRLALVTDGTVEAPRDEIVNELRTRLKRAVNRASKTPHLESAKQAIETAEARLKGLDEALAVFQES